MKNTYFENLFLKFIFKQVTFTSHKSRLND